MHTQTQMYACQKSPSLQQFNTQFIQTEVQAKWIIPLLIKTVRESVRTEEMKGEKG